MDTSNKYILMCREAWKYLKREIELDDVVAYRYVYDGYIDQEVSCFFHIIEKWMIKEDDKDTYIFIVWKQDQLQEMSGLSWWEFDKRCNDMRRCLLEDPLSEIEVETKEQAGMCVLMEKYNKVWNGKDWVKDEKN